MSSPVTPPRSILMIKSHSMGVGDLLRSSAAWRALKLKWPSVKLHLLFLSKHEGYPTEGLIKEHHLLESVEFLTIQKGHPGLDREQRPKVPFTQLVKSVQLAALRCKADWIIDFEPSGARTSLLTWFATKALGTRSLGINQVFGRSLFYTQNAPSVQSFAAQYGYELPLEYTYRDFVALAAWGIYRNQLPIELRVSSAGQLAKVALINDLRQIPPSVSISPAPKEMVIGLNIGCGTPDAVYKRPDLRQLAKGMLELASLYPHRLVLTGAPNERDINEEFIKVYEALAVERQLNVAPSKVLIPPNLSKHILDYAGRTDLSGLTGVIDACDIFISTDSGPYHMSVALRKPTLVWFTYSEHTSFHDVPWCKRLIDPNSDEFVKNFQIIESNLN